jgi:pimeloyl-ACP methyl ester carboxylesterase
VAGHSWGAAIGLWLAALRPDRVRALVLLEGGWFNRRDLPPGRPPADPHHAEALRRLFESSSADAWPHLAHAALPVLAVAGMRNDRRLREPLLAAFQAAVPQAAIAVFPDAGHDLLRDAPLAVATCVADWLLSLRHV